MSYGKWITNVEIEWYPAFKLLWSKKPYWHDETMERDKSTEKIKNREQEKHGQLIRWRWWKKGKSNIEQKIELPFVCVCASKIFIRATFYSALKCDQWGIIVENCTTVQKITDQWLMVGKVKHYLNPSLSGFYKEKSIILYKKPLRIMNNDSQNIKVWAIAGCWSQATRAGQFGVFQQVV